MSEFLPSRNGASEVGISIKQGMLSIMPEIFKTLRIIPIVDRIIIVWFLIPVNGSITITDIVGTDQIINEIININQIFEFGINGVLPLAGMALIPGALSLMAFAGWQIICCFTVRSILPWTPPPLTDV